ncbi:helix-turn-helix domain-containing protein [Deefgea piscis]|uniref:Helix-turn-helix domain-containing protein n=1 Tax=Deefgea piscis TaxID=2739061 RepID=A0A6M8SV69_9NEIS|nr:helix-turn-helix domain-containing protein [Deefgea piscis]QKJ67466.1 helix-turn-helix domain-containing protein [Deefgea piscis]
MSLLSERIKAAMQASGIKSAPLANAAKVTASAVSQWRSGLVKNLDAATCIRAANAMGVSPLWLASGEGQMYSADTTKPIASPAVMPLIERLIRLDLDQNITPKEIAALSTFIDAISQKTTIDQPAPGTAPSQFPTDATRPSEECAQEVNDISEKISQLGQKNAPKKSA